MGVANDKFTFYFSTSTVQIKRVTCDTPQQFAAAITCLSVGVSTFFYHVVCFLLGDSPASEFYVSAYKI